MDPNRFVSHRVLKNAMVAQDISVDSGPDNHYDSYYTIRLIVKKLREDEGTCVQYEKPEDFGICVQVGFLFKTYIGETVYKGAILSRIYFAILTESKSNKRC